jgi:RNA polymerase sigma factor (sigma-70 family)
MIASPAQTIGGEVSGGTVQAICLADVVASNELLSRPLRKVNLRAEIGAMQELAQLLPSGSLMVLERLAQMAIDLCDADSGGISMLEEADGQQIFRWVALAGTLKSYVGGSTPRDWSPCGECLNVGKPMLYSYPARFFTYFQKVDAVIVEGLVIPIATAGQPIGTIWIVSEHEGRKFDAEDVRMMTSLGSFVAAAIHLTLRKGSSEVNPGKGREVVWSELVRRMAAGDPAALASLIEETKPFVFARALRILGSPPDAEEAAADVYSQVWKTAARYDPQRQGVLAWLLNIARSRAIDHLRMRTRQGQGIELTLSVDARSGVDPEASAVSGQRASQVRQAMEALPFEQKRAIEMAYFEGYSAAEIAARLDHPLGSVKTRIRTGLIALRLLMASRISLPPGERPELG